MRKARAEDGGVDDDLGTHLATVGSSTSCMSAVWAETKGATDCVASSVAESFRLRCGSETSIMVVAEHVESENERQSGGGKYTTIQFGEQRPRRTSNPDNWRTAGNSLLRHAGSLQDATHTGINSLAMPG